MPKYWVKNYFAHGRFPKVGQKQKTEKEKKRERERAKVGENNGQATHGARKHAWRTQAAWAKKNIPETAGGTVGRDRTLAVISKKNARKSPLFFRKKIKIT